MFSPRTFTRHAVCLGSTGSGKTGFCLTVLEDLARAGVPLLLLDPKGDLANLALVFPGLSAAEFLPWVDPAEAARLGIPAEALAERTAARWREGLAAAGLGPADLAAFRASVDVRLLTPGSEAAPVDVLTSLTRCPARLRDDPEGLRGWVTGAVGALLDLVGRPANPLTDPEAILLARLFLDAFAAGHDLPFEVLLPRVIDPPFQRLGYFAVDDVLPRRSRTALAHDLNDVLASPAFQAWRTGEALDLDAWTARVDGRTPVRVLTMAHLSDAERMFFVTLFLHAVVAWTRRLSGTGELRALVGLDEAAGFAPPHPRDPPSKAPLLTLVKQARAVGVGALLATQNPVDLDYKVMSNAHTWMIGRQLTDNDRERVLDGLLSAGLPLKRKELAARLAALPSRHFVVRDGEGRAGEVRSRQTMCFLRGPLTRQELLRLVPAGRSVAPAAPASLDAPPPAPDGVPVRWLAPEAAAALPPGGDADWRFALYARFHARFHTDGVVTHRVVHRLLLDGTTPIPVALDDRWLADRAPGGGRYPPLPPRFDQPDALRRALAAWRGAVAREERGVVWRCRDGASALDEDREAFAARLRVDPSVLVREEVALRPGDVEAGWFGVVWVPGR